MLHVCMARAVNHSNQQQSLESTTIDDTGLIVAPLIYLFQATGGVTDQEKARSGRDGSSRLRTCVPFTLWHMQQQRLDRLHAIATRVQHCSDCEGATLRPVTARTLAP
jgi:hypothetical protein